ncbi:hypothetical protein [Phascolarctobacterium sp.]
MTYPIYGPNGRYGRNDNGNDGRNNDNTENRRGVPGTGPRNEYDNGVDDAFRETVNLMRRGADYEDRLAMASHQLGLQGHKRYHKDNAERDRKYLDKLRHYYIDMYDDAYDNSDGSGERVEMPSTLKAYMAMYLTFKKEIVERLNHVCTYLRENGYNQEAKMVEKIIEDNAKELQKVKRWYKDFEKTDWNYSHARSQDQMLHEKMKNKKHRIGFLNEDEDDEGYGRERRRQMYN